MSRTVKLIVAALLVGAFIALAVLTHPAPQITQQEDGSYPIPNSAAPGGSRVMANGEVALILISLPPDAQQNLYVFDAIAHSFTGYCLNPPDFPWLTDIHDIAADSTSTGLACSYVGSAVGSPNLCIASLATGEIVYSVDVGYAYPEIQLTTGVCNGVEIVVGVDPYDGVLFFLNFTDPGTLGTITLPVDYRIPSAWRERTPDYHNRVSGWPYFHFSSFTSTLFLPLPHLGLIYWCQLDLSGGFIYQDGTIPCGEDPTFIAVPPAGAPLYILDDKSNKIFVLDPSTRTVVKSISFEAGSIALRLIEYQGYLYMTTRIISTDPRVGGLIRIDPVTEQQWSVDFDGWSPTDLDAYQGRIYMIKKTGPPGDSTPTLVEYDAITLTQLSETYVSDDGWQMDIVPQTGKGVIMDGDDRALYVVTL